MQIICAVACPEKNAISNWILFFTVSIDGIVLAPLHRGDSGYPHYWPYFLLRFFLTELRNGGTVTKALSNSSPGGGKSGIRHEATTVRVDTDEWILKE